MPLLLRFIAGNSCPDGYFQCGGDSPRCIYSTFVCNSEINCSNGADEDPETCGEATTVVLCSAKHVMRL